MIRFSTEGTTIDGMIEQANDLVAGLYAPDSPPADFVLTQHDTTPVIIRRRTDGTVVAAVWETRFTFGPYPT